LATNTPKPALLVDVELLAAALEKGSHYFLEELNRDQARYALAEERALHLFTRATRLL
jgi:peptide subunit release factor 1 (eRF1)